MRAKIFALLASSVLAFSVACGDSDTEDTSSSTTTTSTGTSMGGMTGSGGETGAMCEFNGSARATGMDFEAACEILFCCAVAECAPVNQSDKDLFVPGCIERGPDNPALVSVVNGGDCAATVSIVGSANATFVETCENGIPAGGSGGTAAGGGAGGT